LACDCYGNQRGPLKENPYIESRLAAAAYNVMHTMYGNVIIWIPKVESTAIKAARAWVINIQDVLRSIVDV